MYGFAGGDPVNFSDPFGLFRIEFANEESEQFYNDLKARLAEDGSDEAQELLQIFATLEDAEQTFEIDVAPGALRWIRAQFHGSAYTDITADAPGRVGSAVSVVAGKAGYGKDVRLTHELGHLYFHLGNDISDFNDPLGTTRGGISAYRSAGNAESVRVENLLRTTRNCGSRPSHGARGPRCP